MFHVENNFENLLLSNNIPNNIIVESNSKDELIKILPNILKSILGCKEFKNKIHQCNFCLNINNNSNIFYLGNYVNDITKIEVLEMVHHSKYASTLKNNKKIYIIKGAELLSEICQNMFLNFLETTNSKNYIIFLTTNYGSILDTLKSRLLHYYISSPNNDIKVHNNLDKKIINFITTKNNNKLYLLINIILELSKLEIKFLLEKIQRELVGIRYSNILILETINKYKNELIMYPQINSK